MVGPSGKLSEKSGLRTPSRSQDWKLGSVSQCFLTLHFLWTSLSHAVPGAWSRDAEDRSRGARCVELMQTALSPQLFPLSAPGGCSGLEDQAELLGVQAERGKPT